MKLIEENRKELELTNILTWQKDNLGENVTIVVLDKGDEVFDYMKNIEIPFDDPKLDTDHGTAVIASGQQIAPNARVIYMAYLSNNKKKEIIDWIIEHKDEIDIINCSFHGATKELSRLQDLDIPVVCAAGNEYYEDNIPRPASFDWTIAVGSYSAYHDSVDGYSNQGKELDCVAPSWIYYNNSKGKEVQQSGTSISTPFVTFSLALYLSWRKRNKLPKLSREEIKQFIHENAKDLYEKGHDYRSGYGLFRLPERIPEVKEVIEVPEFPDVKKDRWSAADIDLVSNLGIMQGLPDGTFAPAKAVTREEIATVIARLIREGYIRK